MMIYVKMMMPYDVYPIIVVAAFAVDCFFLEHMMQLSDLLLHHYDEHAVAVAVAVAAETHGKYHFLHCFGNYFLHCCHFP